MNASILAQVQSALRFLLAIVSSFPSAYARASCFGAAVGLDARNLSL
jgi:hypothetical protein